jgi:hypothetical protein
VATTESIIHNLTTVEEQLKKLDFDGIPPERKLLKDED